MKTDTKNVYEIPEVEVVELNVECSICQASGEQQPGEGD